MKSFISILSALFLALMPAICSAQDIPVPAEESVNPTENSVLSAETSEIPETAAENAEQQATETVEKTPKMLASEQLIQFFSGLEQAVQDANGDCQKISDAIKSYYESHQEWISGLDYATTSVDTQTIDIIHNKAVEFGKKLSACYDQKSIPEMLHRYAGLGEEW